MFADLICESSDVDLEDPWENKRTTTSVRAFAVRPYQTGYSLREKQQFSRNEGLNALTEWFGIGYIAAG
jgi:hypothetical protein